MKTKRIICLVLSLLMCVGIMGACDVVDHGQVISVNGEAITRGEYKFYLDLTKMMQASNFGISDYTDADAWKTTEIDGRSAIDIVKEKAKDELTRYYVYAQKANELGIELTDDEKTSVDTNLDYIANLYYGGKDNFNERIKDCEVSVDGVKSIFTKIIIANKVDEHLKANEADITNISDEDLNTAYESYKVKTLENSIFVKHILIGMNEYSAQGLSRDAALEKATDIYNQIKGGADFETLMRENSEDGEQSFDGYSFTHGDGQFVTEFDNASYALAVGDVSEPVETKFGFHIIKRYPSQETASSLDDVRESLVSQIEYERIDAKVDAWVDDADIVVDEGVYNKIK